MSEKGELELLKLIYDSKKNKVGITKEFITKALEIMVKDMNLHDYIRNIDFKLRSRHYLAKYLAVSKYIKTNLDFMLKSLKKEQKNIHLNNIERAYFMYISVVSILRHEVEHANQARKEDHNIDDLETKILKICDDYLIIQRNTYYEQALLASGKSPNDIDTFIDHQFLVYLENYNIAPPEKLAETYAHTTTLNILALLEVPLESLIMYENYLLLTNFLAGYQNGTPTQIYLKNMGKSRFWPKIEAMQASLREKERLSLGLEVSESTILKLTRTKKEIKKRLFI